MSLMEEYNHAISLVSGEDITPEDAQKGYTKRADTYDKHTRNANYAGPRRIGERVCQVYPPEVRSTIKILDVAAGTGLVGQELKDAGFVHIDALDPSEDMTRKAMEKGIYENHIIEFLTPEPLDIPKDTYDVITGCGLYMQGKGHIKPEAWHEMIRLVKPGGYIWLAARDEYIQYPQYDGMEPFMKQLEEEGKWRIISTSVEPNHNAGMDGHYWNFQVL